MASDYVYVYVYVYVYIYIYIIYNIYNLFGLLRSVKVTTFLFLALVLFFNIILDVIAAIIGFGVCFLRCSCRLLD